MAEAQHVDRAVGLRHDDAVRRSPHDRREIVGAVALAATRAGSVAVEALGVADLETDMPMAENSLFWVASQTKPITATALMMLVDEGKVALDDPVEKYLPEFAGIMVKAEEDAEHRLLRRPAHPPTIREMLSHTSGLPFGSPVEQPTRDGLPLHTVVRALAMLALETEPGTQYAYSNAGFSVAGRIIEVVTGLPYETFLQTRLFDPLGMTDTTFWPTPEQAARFAKAYRPGVDGAAPQEATVDQLTYPITDHAQRFPFPGGGLYSTARDCAQFCRMILHEGELDGRRYVSAAAVAEMTRAHTPAAPGESYGLGFILSPKNRHGHGGALASKMSVDPAAGVATVLLVQVIGANGLEQPLWTALQDEAAARFGSAEKAASR